MTHSDAEIQFFEELAEIARTLGNTHRLILLDHIAQGERPVDRLAELSGMTVANTSQHLQQLKRTGLVQTRREGKRILYRLGKGPVVDMLAALRGFASHSRSEILELASNGIHSPDQLEGITREELLDRLKKEAVTLLDVRPAEEFRLGHLPGAINIPIEELEQRLDDLPDGQDVIAYCRGIYCALSVDAVKALRRLGYEACRLADGFPDWVAAGLQIEKG